MAEGCWMCNPAPRCPRRNSSPSGSERTRTFRAGTPQPVFENADLGGHALGRSYDVSPDGLRFLLTIATGTGKKSGTACRCCLSR